MNIDDVHEAVAKVAQGFADDRPQRQRRTALMQEDFDALAAAGLQATRLPVELGGLWQTMPASARGICDVYRTLAHGDSSVALVCSMHPAVLAYWLATPDVPDAAAVWRAQRTEVFGTVERGAWWGTITSEPGSGDDIAKTRAVARRNGDGYRLTGQKHFGSGSGITSYMVTTAVPEGADDPDLFFIPVNGVAFDGSAGITLLAPWDGHGRRATQSHAMSFADCPIERVAWEGHLDHVVETALPFIVTLFTAVVLGIVEVAVETAKVQLAPRSDSLRPYEQVEWDQAVLEAWTAEQAYDGALRAIETGQPAHVAALRSKTIVAQLAESCLLRICRVLGGGAFAQRSPFGHWFEDVRALGFLRPPWALASDLLIAESFSSTTSTSPTE